MPLDLSAQALVDAGSGVAFVLVAGLFAASRGGGRLRPLLAASLALYGLHWVVQNLIGPGDELSAVLAMSTAAVALVPLVALAVLVAMGGTPRSRWGALALGGLAAALFLATTALQSPLLARAAGLQAAPGGPLTLSLIDAMTVGSGLVAIAAAMRAREGDARAWATLALAFAPFLLFRAFRLTAWPGLAIPGALLAALLVALAWWPRRTDADVRLGARMTMGLLACGLAGEVYGVVTHARGDLALGDHGAHGILRTASALVLALGLLRGRLWDIEPPHVTLRRGPATAAALAALFITAQVAQNFLAAQYGLLLGGIVAGALLFAAHPIERAIDALASAPWAPHAPAAAAQAQRREHYRLAVRAAITNHAPTPEEERALAHLAEALGIGAGEAHDIRAACEAARSSLR